MQKLTCDPAELAGKGCERRRETRRKWPRRRAAALQFRDEEALSVGSSGGRHGSAWPVSRSKQGASTYLKQGELGRPLDLRGRWLSGGCLRIRAFYMFDEAVRLAWGCCVVPALE
jgi:hypothetical protein